MLIEVQEPISEQFPNEITDGEIEQLVQNKDSQGMQSSQQSSANKSTWSTIRIQVYRTDASEATSSESQSESKDMTDNTTRKETPKHSLAAIPSTSGDTSESMQKFMMQKGLIKSNTNQNKNH